MKPKPLNRVYGINKMSVQKLFADRQDAAEKLAEHLLKYANCRPLILAIPRGAVPMGKILAQRLHGELDVVLVHKLGAPWDPEFALGAIDETGETYLASQAQAHLKDREILAHVQSQQLAELQKRRQEYLCDPVGIIQDIYAHTQRQRANCRLLFRRRNTGIRGDLYPAPSLLRNSPGKQPRMHYSFSAA